MQGHNNVFEISGKTVLHLDIGYFCSDLLEGAEQWLRDVVNTPEFQQNASRFAQHYPNGLPPFMVGIPIVS
jgi:hypothetical protein